SLCHQGGSPRHVDRRDLDSLFQLLAARPQHDGQLTVQQPAGHHLAQLDIGRFRYEIDDPRMADFADNLAAVNAIAERSEGFVWRYTDESGNSTATRPYAGDPLMAVNMSVWENVESLEKYVWQTVHKRFYGRRHEWFDTMAERYFVMWWVPAGHL